MKPWLERFPEIYEEERSYWLGRGFEELTSPDGEVSFEGAVTVRRRGEEGLETHDFELRLDYPPGYPFRMPKVVFIRPEIRRARHQGIDGAPCLFPPGAWDKDVRASELYAATERWLNYHLDDHFPRELALYELPEYFDGALYAVLAPAELMKSFAGKQRGGFSYEKLIGHDLCAIRSVDGNRVGEALISDLAGSKKQWQREKPAKWFRLDAEPSPMRHTGELEALLRDSGHQVSLKPRPGLERDLIGLLFTDTILDEERLLLIDIGVRSKTQQPKVGEGWPLRVAELQIASRGELQRRLQGVRDLDVLAEKTVACFGLGAIGSVSALALAREGVGAFTLCDPDFLRSGNVVRHALDLTDVGQLKALAMETAISRVSPGVETTIEYQNLADPRVIATHLDGAHMVIAAIGDEMLEQLLCEIVTAREDPPPVILARTLHAGAAFRVALIRPGVDACFACLGEYQAEGDAEWIEVPEDDLPDVFDSGCATASRPGAGLTCEQAGAFVAARALEVLEARDREANHWLSVQQPIPAADPRLAEPLALHEATFKPRRGCANCGA